MKKLKDSQEAVSRFLGRMETLGDRLGPVLFQLPPTWKYNLLRLRNFLEILPKGFRYAFEFRDRTWFEEEVLRVLREYGAAFCIYEFAGNLSPRHVTADFAYVRLHGPDKEPYRGKYSAAVLSMWAEALSGWAGQKKEVFCYFDNDEAGYAAQNAFTLQGMVDRAEIVDLQARPFDAERT